MIIDDIVNASFKCLKAMRTAERQHGYPEMMLKHLEEADAYLEILRTESPLMYTILRPEYVKVLSTYETLPKV